MCVCMYMCSCVFACMCVFVCPCTYIFCKHTTVIFWIAIHAIMDLLLYAVCKAIPPQSFKQTPYHLVCNLAACVDINHKYLPIYNPPYTTLFCYYFHIPIYTSIQIWLSLHSTEFPTCVDAHWYLKAES